MEELSAYSEERVSDVCRLLRADPNYSPDNYNCFSDDNDDDPLGCPEITVKINDDWTVSSERHFYGVEDDREDDHEDYRQDSEEDGTELDDLEDSDIDTFLNNIISLSQRESISDEEEQIVPSSPAKVPKLMLGEELILSVSEVVGKESEKRDKNVEVKKREEQSQEQEKKKVLDKGITNRSQVDEETGNRSKPHPP